MHSTFHAPRIEAAWRVGSWSLREEDFKSWDSIVSDEIVDCAQAVESDFKTRDCVSLVDWLSKYNSGDIYMELNLALLGERDSYFRCVLDVAPSSITDSKNAKLKFNIADGDNLMLVDVAKLIDSPKRMVFERRPTGVRLKRLNEFEGLRRHVFGRRPDQETATN